MSSRHGWLFLVMAAVMLPVSNGRWSIAPAAWLAPLFLLVFLNLQPLRRGLAVAFPIQVAAFAVNWWGMIPVPGFLYSVIVTTYAAVYFLPFCLQRWLTPHIPGFRSTLILPVSWVGIEFLFQKFVTPYGSWGSIAYTQTDHLALLQLLSVTGMPGISFLMLWFASTGAWALSDKTPMRSRLKGGLSYLAILLTVLVGGEIRMATGAKAADSVNAAIITPSRNLGLRMQEAFRAVLAGSGNDPQLRARLEQRAQDLNQDLLRRTREAARKGAKIVVWSELAARLTKEAEQSWIEQATALARKEGVFLFLGVGVSNPKSKPPFENRVTIITPGGSVADYHKARPIAGAESSLIKAGESRVALIDSVHGRLGTVICHDLDFPDLIRQAGRSQVDVLFGPSSDWDAITPFHGRMSILRSIENGCVLARPCENGLSLVVDPYGRQLLAYLDRNEHGSTLTIPIPLLRVNTLYPIAGDWLAYVSLGAFAAFLVNLKRKRPANDVPVPGSVVNRRER